MVPPRLPSRVGDDEGINQSSLPPRPSRVLPAAASFRYSNFTDEEMEAMIEALTQKDTFQKKTFARQLVENILQKFRWYFPSKENPDAPSLAKAWTYYEHITLARQVVEHNANEDKVTRADAGLSQDTELYSFCRTSESDLTGWGIGIGLYFTTLRVMAVILFVAGLINIANITFYASSSYGEGIDGLSFSLKGSAVCTRREWVLCQDCNCENFATFEQRDGQQCATTPANQTLVQKNNCEGANLAQGMVNYATWFFLIISIGCLSFYLRQTEIRYDEDKSTSTDYSLIVKNPPPDAYNPDEWRDFFSQFADKQVTVVTIAVNNDVMLRKLILRRIYRDTLRRILPKGTILDDEDVVRAAVDNYVRERDAERRGILICLLEITVLPILRRLGMFLKAETLVDRVFSLTGEIKELQKQRYDVTQVFVTFETEEGQRSALTAMAASKLDLLSNNTANTAPSTIFKGRLLRVSEPPEPSATRWLDLSARLWTRFTLRLFNFCLTVGMVALAGIVVARIRSVFGPGYSGPAVTILNAIVPLIIKHLLMRFERHSTEDSWQASLYLKITLFRWINAAVLTQVITPFTGTIGSAAKDVLPTINAILWSELLLVPGLRILDLVGNIRKHILAPRAKTQELMNLSFQGTPYNLGERYTDFTKVLFLCFFYAALFPAALFFGAAILMLQYLADKFCLLRIWAWAPQLGSDLAVFSRRYFFSTAVFAFGAVSSYAWAQFPYDNVCNTDSTGAAGVYSVSFPSSPTTSPTNFTTINVTQDTAVAYCSQEWRDFRGFFFPAIPSRQREGLTWMSSSQERLTSIYGWTSVVAFCIWISIISGGAITKFIVSLFRGFYTPKGLDQKIDFSSQNIPGYVPQIKWPGYPFPFLACNVDDLDESLIGWVDPHRTYDDNNLMFDVPYEGMLRPKMTKKGSYLTVLNEVPEHVDDAGAKNDYPIFSIVKYYPMPWKEEERRRQLSRA